MSRALTPRKCRLHIVLGHCGIATTVRYVHIADPQRRAAIAVHPLNDWLVQQRAAA